MALMTCPDCGSEVCENAAPARPERARKIHPITWVVVAAMIPLLVWDAWESLGPARHHATSSESAGAFHYQPQVDAGRAVP